MRAAAPLLACVAATGLLVGCGGDARTREPDTDAERVVRRAIDHIPRYPRSRMLQASVERDGTIFVASFSVRSATPETIMGFYVDELATRGWNRAMAPTPLGEAIRAEWQRGRQRLLVSTSVAPTVGESDAAIQEPVAQYSFTLERENPSDAPPAPAS